MKYFMLWLVNDKLIIFQKEETFDRINFTLQMYLELYSLCINAIYCIQKRYYF